MLFVVSVGGDGGEGEEYEWKQNSEELGGSIHEDLKEGIIHGEMRRESDDGHLAGRQREKGKGSGWWLYLWPDFGPPVSRREQGKQAEKQKCDFWISVGAKRVIGPRICKCRFYRDCRWFVLMHLCKCGFQVS